MDPPTGEDDETLPATYLNGKRGICPRRRWKKTAANAGGLPVVLRDLVWRGLGSGGMNGRIGTDCSLSAEGGFSRLRFHNGYQTLLSFPPASVCEGKESRKSHLSPERIGPQLSACQLAPGKEHSGGQHC